MGQSQKEGAARMDAPSSMRLEMDYLTAAFMVVEPLRRM